MKASELKGGFYAIGTFQGTSVVKSRAGQEYPGFLKIRLLGVGARPVFPDPTFNEADLDDGEPTAMARSLAKVNPAVGDLVAVRCEMTGQGRFASAEARSITVLV